MKKLIFVSLISILVLFMGAQWYLDSRTDAEKANDYITALYTELLLNADIQLKEKGTFEPMGAVILNNGSILITDTKVLAGGKLLHMTDRIVSDHRGMAEKGEIIASGHMETGYIYDNNRKYPAIMYYFEASGAKAEAFAKLYSIDSFGLVEYGDMYSITPEQKIFN